MENFVLPESKEPLSNVTLSKDAWVEVRRQMIAMMEIVDFMVDTVAVKR